MADRPDRQRLRRTVQGRARLLAAIEMAGTPHVVDPGTLGEYAELVAVRGQTQADAELPGVAAHLASGCVDCADDLRELVALVAESDEPDIPQPSPTQAALTPQPPLPRTGRGGDDAPNLPLSHGRERGLGGEGLSSDDSGIFAVDLPDVRAAEEAARRQRLRRVRDWLLVAAAVSILLIGLSLVGMAYLASGQSGGRIELAPVPSATPSAGRAAPNGMACPGSHPLKGNRTSMIYHPPGAEFYEQTRPEDCFASPADAESAGYRRSLR